jgi:predicted PurR-regulated permease PerM
VLTLAVFLAAILPLSGLTAMIVRQVFDGVTWVRQALASEGIEGILHRLPSPVEPAIRKVIQAIPDPQSQLRRLAEQGGQAAAAVGGLLVATGSVVLDTVLMLVAFFFFLVDGRRLLDWIDGYVPLRPGQFRELADEFRRTTISVLVATVATAGIQTVTAFVGYLIARAPNPIFLALMTFVFALIPALGGTVMIVLVGILQIATGHLWSGVFLLVWGLGVVSLIDNVARPYLLKGGMQLHGGIVFFSLLGGLAVFGGIGLIIGPLIVTFLISVLDMYRRDYGDGGRTG